MSSTSLEVLVIVLLIVISGFFAMSEIALISARKARLQEWAKQHNRRAQIALELAATPNRFLATVQIFITLVGILAGAYGGVTIAEKLAEYFARVPALAGVAHPLAVALIVLLITYFTLTLGELVPKRLALARAERIATRVAGPMKALAVVAAPAVWLLSVSTEGVLRLCGVRPSAEPPVTEEEIKILLQQGEEAGVFEEAELAMVERVLRLDRRRVSAVMTPRPDIVWLDAEDPPEEIRRQIVASAYSRFPVSRGSLDAVLGILQAKDFLAQCGEDPATELEGLLRPAVFVPETMPVLQVMETFRQEGTHLALVVDEYGSIQGLVTINDVLEAIVGEVASAGEAEEPEAVQRPDGSWLLDGMLSVDELKDLLDLPTLPGEERGHYQTLGGFVMTQMGRIPQAADAFDWAGWRFEVVDMDGHRVDKVLVSRQPEGDRREE